MEKKIKRNLYALILVAAAFYLLSGVLLNFESFISSFHLFDFNLLPLILLSACLNLLIRFSRWHFLLNQLKIKIGVKNSAAIFFSNLVMLATPGAIGELFKSYQLKKLTGESLSKTAPIIFTERINDFTALIIISLLTAFTLNKNILIILLAGCFFFFVIFVFTNKSFGEKIIRWISSAKFFQKYFENISIAYSSFNKLMSIRSFLTTFGMSLLSWCVECVTVLLVLVSLNIKTNFAQVLFAYSFSILFGSLTALPAGLGVTDSSLIFLIIEMGVNNSLAAAAAFLSRLFTLWFSVFVGLISLFLANNMKDFISLNGESSFPYK